MENRRNSRYRLSAVGYLLDAVRYPMFAIRWADFH